MKVHLHAQAAGLFVRCCSVTFPFSLTHHLKAARQRESSFTAENLAKINFLLLFLALARQSKHDRFHSFCPRGSHLPAAACAVLFCWFGRFIVAFLIACACIDRMWHTLSTRRQHNLTVQTRVYADTSPCAVCMCTPPPCMCFESKVSCVDGLPLTDWCLCVCVWVTLCLYDCTSLCVCIGWQIAGGQHVQQQVMGGGNRLISSLAFSSYRSPSILFSSCQNSQLCIDSSLLHLIFTRPHNKDRTNRPIYYFWMYTQRKRHLIP